MCMMVYVAAENELPLMEWGRDKHNVLCVRPLNFYSSNDQLADINLAMPYKYHMCSWQGCGCGFSFDFDDNSYDEEQNTLGKQSVQALFDYIRTHVKGDECEILSFWAGDGIEHDGGALDLRGLVVGDRFEFLEGQLLSVTK